MPLQFVTLPIDDRKPASGGDTGKAPLMAATDSDDRWACDSTKASTAPPYEVLCSE